MDDLGRFLRELGAMYRARRIYPRGNEQVRKAAERTAEALTRLGRKVRIARLGPNLVVEERTLTDPPPALLGLMAALGARGQEALQIDLGVGAQDLEEWLEDLAGNGAGAVGGLIRAGVVRVNAAAGSAGAEALPASYRSLLPDVEHVLGKISEESPEGLCRAQEIVFSIASHLAAGDDLLRPVRALKGHDDYTFTHALNVCVLATSMARGLGVPEGRLKTLSLAALCHDLGKEKVTPAILNKAGALDEAERALINRHPLAGASLLLRLRGEVDPLLPVVACQHHRRCDGSGYPAMAGAAAPHPAALLVAVADVYDALRTVRPYRGAWSAPRSLTVLVEEAHRGTLPWRYVSALAALLELPQEGARVRLSDGQVARVRGAGREDPLCPEVEVEGGALVQLMPDNGPSIVALDDEEDAGAED